MESGMLVDLRKRGTGRDRPLQSCRVIVSTLIILITCVGCSRRAAEMPEPPYRVVERMLPFSSRLIDSENQLPQRRFDRQPIPRAEQHRTFPPKAPKVHTPDATRASALRPVSGKKNPPPLLDREKEQLFQQQFLEWRKGQTDMP